MHASSPAHMKVENSCHSFQTLCQKEKFLDIVCNKNLNNLTCMHFSTYLYTYTYTYIRIRTFLYVYLLDNTISTCLLIQFLFASSSNKYSTLSFNILLSSCCYWILWTRTWHLSYLIPFSILSYFQIMNKMFQFHLVQPEFIPLRFSPLILNFVRNNNINTKPWCSNAQNCAFAYFGSTHFPQMSDKKNMHMIFKRNTNKLYSL